MAKYGKERLFIIVNGVEILVTSTPERIILLRQYLSELNISKDGLYFKPSIVEFVKIQSKLQEIISES